MKCRFKRSVSLICALVLIISVLNLAACGQGTNSIVGTWEVSPGNTFPLFWESRSITFYQDGSFVVKRDSGLSDEYGSYKIIRDGSAIEFDIHNTRNFATIDYEFSGNNLVLKTNPECILTRAD